MDKYLVVGGALAQVELILKPSHNETFLEFHKRKQTIANGLEAGTYEQYWDECDGRWKFREVD